MRGAQAIGIALLGALAPGCAPGSDPGETRRSLMEADMAFARETAERGVDGWVSFFTTDGILFPGHGRADGAEAIREAMAPSFADPARSLTWRPTEAFASASADLGYTIGRWELVTRDPDGGTTSSASGNYVTIWRRDPDGSWKVAVDIGNKDAAASGEADG